MHGFANRILPAALEASQPLDDGQPRGAFAAFLADHPELTEEKQPEPLDLADEAAIVAAVKDCFAHWRTEFPDIPEDRCWPSAHQVALRLSKQQRPDQQPYPKVTPSDRMRTVAALKRLARAGRVEVIRREVYGQRVSNDYRVKGGDS
ncbi:MAG TPA: hypothetical protein VNO56_02845 [Gaiellaceae bacterium]|nr:hypothetical protein [Gaiellaceae bacterium]